MKTTLPAVTFTTALVVPVNHTIEIPTGATDDRNFDDLVQEAGLIIPDEHRVNSRRIREIGFPRPMEVAKLYRAPKGTPYSVIRRAMRLDGFPAIDAFNFLRLLALRRDLTCAYALKPYSRANDASLVLYVTDASQERRLKAYPGNDVGHGEQYARQGEFFVGLKE